jgi:hypothetical protein
MISDSCGGRSSGGCGCRSTLTTTDSLRGRNLLCRKSFSTGSGSFPHAARSLALGLLCATLASAHGARLREVFQLSQNGESSSLIEAPHLRRCLLRHAWAQLDFRPPTLKRLRGRLPANFEAPHLKLSDIRQWPRCSETL